MYPPDKVLLPPNMNVIEAHFLPRTGNTIFEIDFENANTDVRLETMCNAITNTRGTATGGCAFSLTPDEWNFVSSLNRGGDPVTAARASRRRRSRHSPARASRTPIPPDTNCALQGQSYAAEACCPGATCDPTTKICFTILQ